MKLHPFSVIRRSIEDIRSIGVPLVIIIAFLYSTNRTNQILDIFLIFIGYYIIQAVKELVYWSKFSYEITEEQFIVRSGVFNLQTRTVPISQIQQVDIVQDSLSSLLGLAVLSCETAGNETESEIKLQYVSKDEATAIRNNIDEHEVPERVDEVTELYKAPFQSLIMRSLTSLHLKYLVLGCITAIAFVLELLSLSVTQLPLLNEVVNPPLTSLGILIIFAMVFLIAWLAGVIITLLKFYDLTILREGDTLKSRAGLLASFTTNVPIDKIQMMRVSSNFLQRPFNYSELTVASAGTAKHKPWPFRRPLIPLDTTETVEVVAQEILPHQKNPLHRPPKVMRRRYAIRYTIAICILSALTSTFAYVYDFTTVVFGIAPLLFLPLGPVLAHLSWRNRAIGIHDDRLILERGVVRHHTYVVPIDSIQKVTISQSVLQRHHDLATVSIATASPFLSVGVYASDMDVETSKSIQSKIKDT